MQKNKKIGYLSLLLLSPLTMAMQPMDDQSLATTTGQDGINIGVNISKIEFTQAALIDNDAFGLTTAQINDLPVGHPDRLHTQRAGLVMAGSSAGTSVGLEFLGATNKTLNIIADTDAGSGTGNTAFANIKVGFDNSITGLKISPFSVYLAGKDSLSTYDSATGAYTRASIFTGATLNGDVKELLRVGQMQINFAANNNPMMNIQLGAAPQGHMIKFGGAITNICGTSTDTGCNMMVVAGTDSGSAYGISFNFQMNGSTVVRNATTGKITSYAESPFSLQGFYAGIEGQSSIDNGGFVFGNENWSGQFDLRLNSLTLGKDGAVAATNPNNTFNGLPNAPIGNIGMVGAKIQDLKVKVSGM